MSSIPSRADTDFLPELEQTTEATVEPIQDPTVQSFENVPLKISAVLGKTKIDVASLKSLSAGAIIELDRKVGEPIDLYIGERLIARGELVMVEGVLGVTMTEIVREEEG